MEGSAGTRNHKALGSEAAIRHVLAKAGLPDKAIIGWQQVRPGFAGKLKRDAAAAEAHWSGGTALLAKLPKKPKRHFEQQAAAEAILAACRNVREEFLSRHADTVYRKLTSDLVRFPRVDTLCYDAAKLVPGLTPTRKEVEAESRLAQSEKDGVEVDQGIFLANVLAHKATGLHLCHAMLLPKPDAIAQGARYAKDGIVDFGSARIERRGKTSILTLQNSRFLNAEDGGTLCNIETAADIAILDPQSEICVLRGGKVEYPKYKDRRVFCAGINLTHLYRGKIPFLWYIERDMGVVNKMLRGVARPDRNPDEMFGGSHEKPWVAQLDMFAIGGGGQYLLAMDYVVAGSDAYMTLPARKEGIIPGLANLRFPRFVGPRLARQAIMMGARLDCSTPEGRMVCDLVVPPDQVEQATMKVCDDFTSSGMISAAGNRRAFRVGEEPLDLFRRYMAVYCREQAYCHFSLALIANLEEHWNAANREI